MSGRRPRAVLSIVLGVVAVLGIVAWALARPPSVSSRQDVQAASAAGSTTSRRGTASTGVDPETGLRWIDAADLPSQGRAVLASIDAGGPFPYTQDGGTFSNAERLLPSRARGFYTEYTVKLPSSSDRGPVRIIMGGKGQWYFWTDDHYASFSRIRR